MSVCKQTARQNVPLINWLKIQPLWQLVEEPRLDFLRSFVFGLRSSPKRDGLMRERANHVCGVNS